MSQIHAQHTMSAVTQTICTHKRTHLQLHVVCSSNCSRFVTFSETGCNHNSNQNVMSYLHPRVLKSLTSCKAVFGIDHQQTCLQIQMPFIKVMQLHTHAGHLVLTANVLTRLQHTASRCLGILRLCMASSTIYIRTCCLPPS